MNDCVHMNRGNIRDKRGSEGSRPGSARDVGNCGELEAWGQDDSWPKDCRGHIDAEKDCVTANLHPRNL
jgi:hypothetical protein